MISFNCRELILQVKQLFQNFYEAKMEYCAAKVLKCTLIGIESKRKSLSNEKTLPLWMEMFLSNFKAPFEIEGFPLVKIKGCIVPYLGT